MRMLYSQRTAYAKMSRPRRMLHMLLWHLYQPIVDWPWARRAWGRYRQTWPQ